MAEFTTLARPYAKAAFSSAQESNALDSWSTYLATAEAIATHNKVSKELASPNLTASAKAQLLIELGGDFDSSFKSFLHVLADNDRLPLLAEIREVFELLKASLQESIDVVIETAFELDNDTLEQLKHALNKKLGATISISTALEPSLIGGVVIKAGDTVIDGSIKGRLSKLATVLNR